MKQATPTIHSPHHYRTTVAIVLLLVIDGLFFGLTNPVTAPAALLVIGYGLVIMTIYCLCSLICGLVAAYFGASAANSQRLALLLTITVAVSIGMQSVGQLSPKDLGALLPLVAISYFYMSYKQRPTN